MRCLALQYSALLTSNPPVYRINISSLPEFRLKSQSARAELVWASQQIIIYRKIMRVKSSLLFRPCSECVLCFSLWVNKSFMTSPNAFCSLSSSAVLFLIINIFLDVGPSFFTCDSEEDYMRKKYKLLDRTKKGTPGGSKKRCPSLSLSQD